MSFTRSKGSDYALVKVKGEKNKTTMVKAHFSGPDMQVPRVCSTLRTPSY